MKRDELLRSEGYWISKIQLDLYHQFETFMSENKINRTKLAKKLGVSKGYITQVLNGDFNHKISKLVELSIAMNKIPEINFKDLNQLIDEENEGIKTITWQVKVKKSIINENDFIGQSNQIGKTAVFNTEANFNESVVNFY